MNEQVERFKKLYAVELKSHQTTVKRLEERLAWFQGKVASGEKHPLHPQYVGMKMALEEYQGDLSTFSAEELAQKIPAEYLKKVFTEHALILPTAFLPVPHTDEFYQKVERAIDIAESKKYE